MDWADWFRAKSRSFRYKLGQGRRELEASGRLTFSEVLDQTSIERAVDWIFDRKVDFIRKQDIRKSWVLNRQNRMLFSNIISSFDGAGIYTLYLNGDIIAAAICFESIDTIEFYMTAFDARYARSSPGNILIEELTKVAFMRKKALDFRITHDAYKLRWADSLVEYRRYTLALSRAGELMLRAAVLQPGWHRFKRTVKLALNRARVKPSPDAP
jgi:CelD/BcsL family acetyltransferase involved in cellulose biosynthesis